MAEARRTTQSGCLSVAWQGDLVPNRRPRRRPPAGAASWTGREAEIYAGVEALLPEAWPGGWLLLDLPGHGRSAWDPPYTFRRYADAVLSVLPAGREAVVVGHSMGGVVALEMAADPRVRGVVAFGVKVSWPDSDVEAAQRLAGSPVRVFATRDEAVQRHLRLAGLTHLVSPEDSVVGPGVQETAGGWRVAQDPATFGVGVPDMAGLLARAECPVVLARGQRDPMVSDGDQAALVADPVVLPGLGHNPHVENPAAVLALVSRLWPEASLLRTGDRGQTGSDAAD